MTLRFSVPKGGRRTSHGHIPQGLDRRQVPGDEHEPRVRRARRLHHRKLLEARRMRPSRQGGKRCSCLPSWVLLVQKDPPPSSFPNYMYLFGGNEAFSNSDEWTQYCRLRPLSNKKSVFLLGECIPFRRRHCWSGFKLESCSRDNLSSPGKGKKENAEARGRPRPK